MMGDHGGQKQSRVGQPSSAHEHGYSRDKPEQGLGGRMAVSRSASIRSESGGIFA